MRQLVSAHIVAGALALALASVIGSATAANQSIKLGASNVSMRVFDLIPGDAVAAGYGINGFGTTLEGYLNDRSGVVEEEVLIVPGGTADDLSMTLADRTFTSSVGATLGAIDSTYVAESPQPIGTSIYTSAIQVVTLTLAPHSLLVVDGTGYIGADNWHAGRILSEVAFSLSGASGTPFSSASLSGYDWADYQLERGLQLAYANVTGQDLSVALTIRTYLSVSAVPEPSTGLMLAAGAAVIGLASRRRKHA